ncbi:class E sortase [Microbacterium capsulatum]|uniref:Class E sortase n=1 Tax=Microbacterium capsulatum TaxID=3041921 RepID=A0ABU0XIU6_9MICO|nr:class E sortase [Microbacterium sp. ASV81]MDQ4214777.1 class E sortase [Microbacterium sp. ASV81]
MTDAAGAAPRRLGDPRRPRRGASFTGVLGELLLTAGVVVLLYVVWQMWIGDAIMSAEENGSGHAISQAWAKQPAPSPPPIEDGTGVPGVPAQYTPPVMAQPANGVPWGAQMRVPRFGRDYNVTIAGGVSRPDTLDHGWIGVYPESGLPGQPGNFSMAAHRTTWGKPFNQLDKLRLNDAIVIETSQGWYTYRFRTLEYVAPDSVDVLDPVPQDPALSSAEAARGQAGEKYITLTACSPLYSLAERIIAYGVFESFQPRALGAPASLKAVS